MPRLETKINELIDDKYPYSSISIDQLFSYIRCGEYYRNEILERVPAYVTYKSPYQLLMLYTAKFMLSKLKLGLSKDEIETEILFRFSLNRLLLEEQGFSFFVGNKLSHLVYSLFKLFNHLREKEDSILEINVQKAYIANGVSVSFTIPIETNKEIYLFTTLTELSFCKSLYLYLPLLHYWNKKINVIYFTDSSLTVKEFCGSNIDLRKLNSLCASYLFSYRKKIFIPILDCKNISCPLYEVCTGMTSDAFIEQYLETKNNESRTCIS